MHYKVVEECGQYLCVLPLSIALISVREEEEEEEEEEEGWVEEGWKWSVVFIRVLAYLKNQLINILMIFMSWDIGSQAKQHVFSSILTTPANALEEIEKGGPMVTFCSSLQEEVPMGPIGWTPR